MRIVSLLPSATEIICALGLRQQLVGVTHECDFPESVVELPKVTRTLIPVGAASLEIDRLVRQRAKGKLPLYQLDVATLQALEPDLIVTQSLCDVCAVDEAEVRAAAEAMQRAPRVLNLEPISLRDVFDGMRSVAVAADVADAGNAAVGQLENRVRTITERSRQSPRPSVAFLEWINPLFCAGHWNPELVDLAGGEELIGRSGSRSRQIDWAQLQAADPDLLFIACCGFTAERAMADLPILKNQPGWDRLKAVRNHQIHVTDGSAYFNRPGPRLVDSLQILAKALHPEIDFDGSIHLPRTICTII
jgi:iron complex transport system substrate-binding protein